MTQDTNGANGLVAAGPLPAVRGSENGHASGFSSPLLRHQNESTAVVLVASEIAGLRKQWRQAMDGRFTMYEVSDCNSLERSLASERPCIVLLDLQLPGLNGIGGVVRIRRLRPPTRIVVLTSRPDEREGVAAVKAGAWGYSHRNIAPALLVKALDVVQKGEIWIGRKLIPPLLKELSVLSEPPPSPRAGSDGALGRLTPREHEIALLVGSGATNKKIATTLHITERTVKAHMTATFRKLGVCNRFQLALFMLDRS